MDKYFTNKHPIVNLYKKPKKDSELITQMIYGESFQILKKNKSWFKIKIKEDKYVGYIKNISYHFFLKPTHKICKINAPVYASKNKRKKIKILPFGSKIKVIKISYNLLKFKDGWVSIKNIKPIDFKDTNIFKRIKIFKNIKYKWGGKTYEGIDCSALIQVILNFNNVKCPRDTGDQFKFFKNSVKMKNLKKNDIIYWKGHVALVLNKNKLIHAYGPKKKTLEMNINKTIKIISDTADLKVIGVKRIY